MDLKHGHRKRRDTNIHLPINHAAQFCAIFSCPKLNRVQCEIHAFSHKTKTDLKNCTPTYKVKFREGIIV